ncbi:MAG: hypothetical protein FWF50_06555 [Defluviitaleaceae bacterium]|nr:hypothetical protein [Defluviitaleaceae bacterium]
MVHITFVIFGASGDLTSRKLIPAFNNLCEQGVLPKDFKIIAIGRRDLAENYKDGLKPELAAAITYHRMDFSISEQYKSLESLLTGNILFFLSVAPEFYASIAKNIAHISNSKIILEKPFGYDLQSAKDLNNEITKYFKEENIYRIDHYLGKDAVRGLPKINREEVSHIQITAKETLGIEGRGPFYEKAGALRDMVQNHIMEIIAGLLREDGEDIRIQKSLALKTLEVLESVRGQYKTYRHEDRVSKTSTIETYVALKLVSKELPIYVRTGKKLDVKQTTVYIKYKNGEEETFNLQIGNKGNGYEKLILNSLKGDPSLFIPFQTLETTWSLLTPLLKTWESGLESKTLVFYEDYSEGPSEANELIERDGLKWI